MLRILRIIPSVNPSSGGPVEAMCQSARIHILKGHEVHVVCLDHPNSPWLLSFPFEVYALGPSCGKYAYAQRLVPWLREHAPSYDCAIIEGIWQYHSFGTWYALRNTGIPFLVFTHGMLDPWFKRNSPLKHLKKWLYWPWTDYKVLRDAAAVLFTCEEERRLARKSFWLYRAHEAVVEFGTMGVPDFQKDYASGFLEKYPNLRSFRRFVFLGRVHPKKGPDIIIQVLSRLQRAGYWDPATMRLIMAGPCDGDYAKKLDSIAHRLGVQESIVWTGMILGDEKWGALQCSEAFVLPSHQENFGIAVVESLSVGVPVLISKAVNIWSDIVNDGAGTAGDDTNEGFERQMLAWLKLSTNRIIDMRKRARICFETRYTATRAAESLLSRIHEVKIRLNDRSKSNL